MSQQWLTIVGATVSVFSVIGIGAVSRRAGWLNEEADHSLLELVIRVLLPCLIFSAVSNNQALKLPSNIYLPPLIGFTTICLGLAVAAVAVILPSRLIGPTSARERRTFMFSVGVHNYGYLAIPLVIQLFDEETLGVLFMHNMGAGLAFWSFGFMILSGRWDRRWYRHMINAPTVAIVFSLAFNSTGAGEHVPGFIAKTIEWLGQASIPLSLILIGATIADELRPGAKGPNMAATMKIIGWACLLRVGLLPIGFLLIAILMPGSLELKRVLVVEAGMPSAVLPIVLARHYGGDPGTALRVALSTSMLALFTLPLWISLGLAIIE